MTTSRFLVRIQEFSLKVIIQSFLGFISRLIIYAFLRWYYYACNFFTNIITLIFTFIIRI